MPRTSDLKKTTRKELHVFYILDTSGSMDGAPISALNHAVEETTEALRSLAQSNGDADLKIAVMEFNSGCRWITVNGPETAEDFEWEYLTAGGQTDIGAALKELDSKLSRHAYLKSMVGALMPVIIFMTDGYASDEYADALEQIRQNKWFKHGTKIGFAIGDDPDEVMLASVVGDKEAVIKTTNLEIFKRLMKFVSVRASMLASQSHTTKTETSGDAIVKAAKEELGLTDDITPNLNDDQYNKEPVTNTKDADDEYEDDGASDW